MSASLPPTGREDGGTFHQVKPEWQGPPCRKETIDVNLGHTPESFVSAAYSQITGQSAPAEIVELWSRRLRSETHVRRVDVVRSLAGEERRDVRLAYSDPWLRHPALVGAPERRRRREVGAVFMFFFDCPGGVNCGMDWANTHALAMDAPHPLYGARRGEKGIYSACQPGFWRRELLDAKYAGLQFLLLNTYGPDIANGKLAPLGTALASLEEPVKVALFDDTWTWGQNCFTGSWRQKPNLADTEMAARILYETKWKPFYQGIHPGHWYRFKGRPFIYFYNGGTLEPRDRSAAVIANMKERFQADFREDPMVCVDGAFFDDPEMAAVADSTFTWMTLDLPGSRSRSLLKGHVVDHAMVKWDSVGRDRPGEIATERDRVLKDSTLLERVLADSADAELLVLATWNDLGEGTGINRNYDYYAGGRWLEPDHFMRCIRESQSQVDQ